MNQTLESTVSKVLVANSTISIMKFLHKQSPKDESRKDFLFTFYYPYYFYEYKVTVPRYLFRDVKALIRIGVNGINGIAAQTEIWPEAESSYVEKSYQLKHKFSFTEADDECQRALERYVYKTTRPLKPPIYQLNKKEIVYIPYHVILEEKNGKENILILEALTGVLSNASKMPGIKEWIEYKLQ
jgi:hypothetical protein